MSRLSIPDEISSDPLAHHAGNDGVGLLVRVVGWYSYQCEHIKVDGQVPASVVTSLAGSRKLIAKLVSAGELVEVRATEGGPVTAYEVPRAHVWSRPASVATAWRRSEAKRKKDERAEKRAKDESRDSSKDSTGVPTDEARTSAGTGAGRPGHVCAPLPSPDPSPSPDHRKLIDPPYRSVDLARADGDTLALIRRELGEHVDRIDRLEDWAKDLLRDAVGDTDAIVLAIRDALTVANPKSLGGLVRAKAKQIIADPKMRARLRRDRETDFEAIARSVDETIASTARDRQREAERAAAAEEARAERAKRDAAAARREREGDQPAASMAEIAPRVVGTLSGPRPDFAAKARGAA